MKEQHLKIGYRYITTVTINNSYEKIPFLSFFLIKTSMKKNKDTKHTGQKLQKRTHVTYYLRLSLL